MEKQLGILPPNRKKLLRRLLLLVLVGYSAFNHRADIKRGWQDGRADSYSIPATVPQR